MKRLKKKWLKLTKTQTYILIGIFGIFFIFLGAFFLLKNTNATASPFNSGAYPNYGVQNSVNKNAEFILTGTVSEINIDNNFFKINFTDKEEKIKIIVSEKTKFLALAIPEEHDTVFTLVPTEIKFEELKEGMGVFIQSNSDITNKAVLEDIAFIEIMPL